MTVVNALLTTMSSAPLVFYPGVAALLLLAVSLLTGLGRLDFVALVKPSVLVRVCLAVLAAFALSVLSESSLLEAVAPTLRASVTAAALFPLYLVALGYGPSAGLLAAVLFAPLGADGAAPGWQQLLLALELVVIGWLAIYPSPRLHRWAGPLNVLLARALVIMSAGVASLSLSGVEVDAATLLRLQLADLPATALALAILLAFGPASYQQLFPHSRIAVQPLDSVRFTAADPLLEQLAPLTRRGRGQRRLETVHLDAEDPNA